MSQIYSRCRLRHSQHISMAPKTKHTIANTRSGMFWIACWTTFPGVLLPSDEEFWRGGNVPGNTTNPASKLQRANTANKLNLLGTLYDWTIKSLCLAFLEGASCAGGVSNTAFSTSEGLEGSWPLFVNSSDIMVCLSSKQVSVFPLNLWTCGISTSIEFVLGSSG